MPHRFLWWSLGVILLGISVWLGTQTYREFRRGEEIRREIDQLKQEESRIREENGILKNNIEYLKTDDSQELEAKKMNYQKADEHMVVFQESVASSEQKISFSENKQTSASVIFRKPNYRLWLEQFFDF